MKEVPGRGKSEYGEGVGGGCLKGKKAWRENLVVGGNDIIQFLNTNWNININIV